MERQWLNKELLHWCKKVKFTLEQATKAQRRSRGIALLFNLGARWRWVVNATSRLLYPRERPGTHCIRGWVGHRAGLECRKSRPPTGIRPSYRPARSASLYRLRYPGPHWCKKRLLNSRKIRHKVDTWILICNNKWCGQRSSPEMDSMTHRFANFLRI